MAGKSKRQVRRGEKQWSEIVCRFDSSELGTKEFCVGEGLTLSSFQRWRRRVLGSVASADFVELVPTPSPAPASAASWAVEVSLPNGVCLRFRG